MSTLIRDFTAAVARSGVRFRAARAFLQATPPEQQACAGHPAATGPAPASGDSIQWLAAFRPPRSADSQSRSKGQGRAVAPRQLPEAAARLSRDTRYPAA